jgi:F-type H+-transporting ATPase subunit delta
MNSLRIARVALSARSSALRTTTMLKRSYADVAPDKIKLTLALPHQAIYKSQDVYVCLRTPRVSGRPLRPKEKEHGCMDGEALNWIKIIEG